MSIYRDKCGFPIGGWLMEEEDYDALDDASTDALASCRDLFHAPEEIDPRRFMKTEHQGMVGSCQGHALTSCMEYCWYVQTGKEKQFSRAMGYYGSQRIDGIRGDRGSTLNGGRRLATEHGVSLEEEWPYVARYNPRPPGGWNRQFEKAEPFKIRSSQILRQTVDVFDYLASGFGSVEIGIPWGVRLRGDTIVSWSPRGGGHAVAILGYTRQHEFWMFNSHGPQWGDNGWAKLPWDICEEMIRFRGSVFQGLSDMSTPEPREFDVELW